MNKFTTLITATAIGLSAAAVSFVPEVTKVAKGPVKVESAPVKYHAAAKRSAAKVNISATPLFTADVKEALAPVWSENFDNGSLKNWTIDAAKNVSWAVKAFSGDKSFDAYDPENLNSLYVEGPYQVYNREISSITSGEFIVPFNGSLSAYVGYSLNYDDVCRLIISISTDDFETSTDLWNSKDGEGERPWAWRAAKADLSQWAGEKAKIRITYSWGSKDETFKTGGYMGDFVIDGLQVSGLSAIGHVALTTGEKLRLVSLVPDTQSYKWTLPGATPAESTEANPEIFYTTDGTYSVTLEVTTADGETTAYTAADFATVTGTAPVAKILPPATFSYVDATLEYPYLVAPLASVKFNDASSGFPTDRTWVFAGLTDGDPNAQVEINDEKPSVNYMYQHNWPVGLVVANEHGVSSDLVTVAAEYQGAITNWKKNDYATTFDMHDWGTFPGSNSHGITRYAERFSAPARPAIIGGAYVYFMKAPSELQVTDNNTITVSVYTSENGLPGQRLDFGLWDVIDLNGPTAEGSLQGTWFDFTDLPTVSDEFFIVIDGLPESRDDFEGVAFGMAGWRSEGNTALLEIDGQWREANDYFGADKCTSYLIRPVIRHSVITSLPVGDDTVLFDKDGGETAHTIFSYMGREENVACDADWCRVTSAPGEYTIDELTIACDPNPTNADREAHLTITDGVGTHVLTVKQSFLSIINVTETQASEVTAYPSLFNSSFTVKFPCGSSLIQVVDLNGRLVMSQKVEPTATSAIVDGSSWATGVYIVLIDDKPVKVAKM